MHVLVAESEPCHDPGAEVLDDHVRLGGELEHAVADLRVSQVGLGSALVPVEGEERVHLAVALAVEDSPEAHPLAADLLDLDHVGAEVAQHLSRHRPLNERSEVEHPDAAERPAHFFPARVDVPRDVAGHQSAVHRHRDPRHHAGLVARQEEDDVRDVLGLDQPADRMRLRELRQRSVGFSGLLSRRPHDGASA